MNRYSDSFREGRRDGERSYSDYDYDRDKNDRYGSEQQRDYHDGWEEAREEKRYEERRQEEREQEEQEQRRAEQRAYQIQQEQYEYEQQQMMEYHQQYDLQRLDDEIAEAEKK